MTVSSFAREGRRRAVDRLATTLVVTCFVLAMAPLAAILVKVIAEGASVVNATFLTHSQRNIGPNDAGGGIYHGIIGTLEQALITSVIAVPLAVLTAIYLVEYGKGWLARLVTFFVDVMTGMPVDRGRPVHLHDLGAGPRLPAQWLRRDVRARDLDDPGRRTVH